jgi:hypothetical protein
MHLSDWQEIPSTARLLAEAAEQHTRSTTRDERRHAT